MHTPTSPMRVVLSWKPTCDSGVAGSRCGVAEFQAYGLVRALLSCALHSRQQFILLLTSAGEPLCRTTNSITGTYPFAVILFSFFWKRSGRIIKNWMPARSILTET